MGENLVYSSYWCPSPVRSSIIHPATCRTEGVLSHISIFHTSAGDMFVADFGGTGKATLCDFRAPFANKRPSGPWHDPILSR
jgi:hypothetical protein